MHLSKQNLYLLFFIIFQFLGNLRNKRPQVKQTADSDANANATAINNSTNISSSNVTIDIGGNNVTFSPIINTTVTVQSPVNISVVSIPGMLKLFCF